MVQWDPVTRYVLYYAQPKQTVVIHVETVSGWHRVDELPLEKAAFLSDMLRNEKPIYYAPEIKSLKTNAEPIGEGEA